MNNDNKRMKFASRIGFLLATAGSAVGLGNLWKFPYLAGQNGGFLFVVVSLIVVFLIGVPVMMSEMAIGRNTQKSPVGAYSAIDKRYRIFGIMPTFVAFLILSYYSVIGGWVIKYLFTYITGGLHGAASETVFASFIGSPVEPIIWHFIFMGITIGICLMGINKGIEKASEFMMPALFIIVIVTCIRSVTLPGAMEGIKFLFTPNFDKITSPDLYIGALSQAFYSLSLGMSIIITYGSYMDKKENIAKSAGIVCSMDLSVAVLASVAIMPAVFSAGLEPSAGPSLIFITLPHVFEQMPMGILFAVLFFILVLFAAVTSSISLLETVAAYAIDERGWSRPKAVLGLGIVMALLGIPSSLSQGIWSEFTIMNLTILDFLSFLTDNIMLPICAFCMCIYIARVWKVNNACKEIGFKSWGNQAYSIIIQYIAPLGIASVFIYGLLPYLGITIG